MRCPFCETDDTRVIDSRLASQGDKVRRRRLCSHCDMRFSTYEVAELTVPMVRKRDGRREPFAIEKIRQGLQRSLEKRPVAVERQEHLLRELLKTLQASGDREVSSDWLGEWLMQELLGLDRVAYLRFASVYLNFDDVTAFEQAIAQLKRKAS